MAGLALRSCALVRAQFAMWPPQGRTRLASCTRIRRATTVVLGVVSVNVAGAAGGCGGIGGAGGGERRVSGII